MKWPGLISSWRWFLIGGCLLLAVVYAMQPPPVQVQGPPIDFGFPRQAPLHSARYSLADILNALAKKRGQVQIDLEEGGFTGDAFYRLIDFDKEDYFNALQDLLGSQGWGCEMRGPTMVIYDKRLRTLGEQYPLNRTITSLKLNNVSLKECLAAIARQVHARINGGAGPMVGSNPSLPLHNFSVELTNMTLREALYKIAAQYGCKGWETSTYTIGDKTYVSIFIQ